MTDETRIHAIDAWCDRRRTVVDSEEAWRDIRGYEGFYQVSDKGLIRSLDRYINNNGAQVFREGQMITGANNGSGYLQCHLHKYGVRETVFVHKIVAQEFIENPRELSEVNHIDHDKNNNSAKNLEWCTREENMTKMAEFYNIRAKVVNCACGKRISSQSISCIDCENEKRRLSKGKRKVKNRPEKEELLNLIKTKSFLEVGRIYGVSDNAIRNWCKSYGIPHRKRDLKNYNAQR